MLSPAAHAEPEASLFVSAGAILRPAAAWACCAP